MRKFNVNRQLLRTPNIIGGADKLRNIKHNPTLKSTTHRDGGFGVNMMFDFF